MNITQNPQAHATFKKYIAAKDWFNALGCLTATSTTARPSDAGPDLVAFLRKDRSLLAGDQCIHAPGGMRTITASVLEPDRDSAGFVTADWLTDVVPLETRYPHYSTNWRAAHMITHCLAFGKPIEALDALRTMRLSARKDDFGGELWASARSAENGRVSRRDADRSIVHNETSFAFEVK